MHVVPVHQSQDHTISQQRGGNSRAIPFLSRGVAGHACCSCPSTLGPYHVLAEGRQQKFNKKLLIIVFVNLFRIYYFVGKQVGAQLSYSIKFLNVMQNKGLGTAISIISTVSILIIGKFKLQGSQPIVMEMPCQQTQVQATTMCVCACMCVCPCLFVCVCVLQ